MSQTHEFHNYRAINSLVEISKEDKYGKCKHYLIVTPYENARANSEVNTPALLVRRVDADSTPATTSSSPTPLINAHNPESETFDVDELKWPEVLQAALSGKAIKRSKSHVGIIFQGMQVRPNHVHEFVFSASFRHVEPSEYDQPVTTYPCVEITISNPLTSWKYMVPAELTFDTPYMYATFVVPPGINFVNMEVMFSTRSFYERTKPCELLIYHDACYLRPILTFMQPYQQISSASGNLVGSGRWSPIHSWFDGVYIIHDSNVSLSDSFAFQRRLSNYGIHFHFLHRPSSATSTRARDLNTHERQCNTCFYESSLQWMDLQDKHDLDKKLPESVSSCTNSPSISPVVYLQALKHASICGYDRILFVSDDVALRRDFNDYVKEYLNTVPNGWKMLLMGANCFETSVTTATTQPAGSKSKIEHVAMARYFSADGKCLNSFFAFGLNGITAQKEFEVFLQQQQIAGKETPIASTAFDLAFRTWMVRKFPSEALVLQPNLIIPNQTNIVQLSLQESPENVKRLANLRPGDKLYWNRANYDDFTMSNKVVNSCLEQLNEPKIDIIVTFTPPSPVPSSNLQGRALFVQLQSLFQKLNSLVATIVQQKFKRWKLTVLIPILPWSATLTDASLHPDDRKLLQTWMHTIDEIANHNQVSVLRLQGGIVHAITSTLMKDDRSSDFVTLCGNVGTLFTTDRLFKIFEELLKRRTNDAFVHLRACAPLQKGACEPSVLSWPDAVVRKSSLISLLLSHNQKLTTTDAIHDAIKEQFKHSAVCVAEILTCES
jgi:hypothetical protein